jgi:MFS family permease
MAIFHLIFFIHPGNPTLYVLAVGTGLAYGGSFASVPTLISLLFGSKHFGANFGVSLLAPALGTFIFGYTAGVIYDDQVS